MHRLILLAGLTLVACNSDKGESQPLGSDTGSSTGGDEGGDEGGDDGGETGGTECTAEVLESTPYDAQVGFYYRAPIEVIFDSPASDQATIVVVASGGGQIPTAVSWDENGINATVVADGLLGDSSYEIEIDLCGDVTTVGFTTDVYGSPMEVAP